RIAGDDDSAGQGTGHADRGRSDRAQPGLRDAVPDANRVHPARRQLAVERRWLARPPPGAAAGGGRGVRHQDVVIQTGSATNPSLTSERRAASATLSAVRASAGVARVAAWPVRMQLTQ